MKDEHLEVTIYLRSGASIVLNGLSEIVVVRSRTTAAVTELRWTSKDPKEQLLYIDPAEIAAVVTRRS